MCVWVRATHAHEVSRARIAHVFEDLMGFIRFSYRIFFVRSVKIG